MGLLTQQKVVGCITKVDRFSPYERITAIGGGTILAPWKMPLDEAIQSIELGMLELHTHVGGHRRKVVVATAASGRKYLRTEADADTPDNLLSLPPCP
ncbi:DUF3892 domain-containing protein [Stenotrophomonas rhizophila]|uniref:DUF3892 domain-containing protein n=1 Tax=Stenotrophomonas rhizophila TaxID=216778 RepID=UPI000B8958C8|nr:DUF3892 domain-containing protein [Stenotrophomonas rhizophila]